MRNFVACRGAFPNMPGGVGCSNHIDIIVSHTALPGGGPRWIANHFEGAVGMNFCLRYATSDVLSIGGQPGVAGF